MYRPERIHFGERVTVEDQVHLDARGAGIRAGAGAQLCFGSYLKNETPEGYIHIGEGTYIGAHSVIYGHRGLEIGDHVLIAPQALIVPYQHNFESKEKLICEQGGQMEKVVIEDDVYMGMAVRVLSGVCIGRGAVVGAGAVVTKNVPPYVVVAGVPARVLRYR
jgi:acetyltransferase-like isoleucine patch superfamily enzyme